MSARLLDPRLGEPVEVGEAAVEGPALSVGLPLPAEDLPDLGIVVEGEDRLGPDGLEELGRAHAAQHVGRRAAEGLEVAQSLVELCAHAYILVGGFEERGRRAL